MILLLCGHANQVNFRMRTTNRFIVSCIRCLMNHFFWIHLNVDYPFHLTGILYFPKVKSNIELNKNKIQLYCNQVYVTDSVEGIVPDFLTLLHGVIDSPDIPLNVSRSYLQKRFECEEDINIYHEESFSTVCNLSLRMTANSLKTSGMI